MAGGRSRVVIRAFLLLSGLAAVCSGAADSVLVVVNASSPLSKSIGEYYARKRGIPRSNVCVIKAPQEETIDRTTYDQIEKAISTCLRKRVLVEKIRYIVTTAGVPLRVSGASGTDGDCAAVDSELTLLYAKLHGRKFPVKGLVANPFFNRPSAQFRHSAFPIYLVTRLAAYDFKGVRALIDRALLARNRGVFVLDARSTGDETGDDWLRTAAIALPESRTVFEQTATVLYRQKNVIGYASWGSNDPNRKERRLRFSWLPGAIMTEYVSTNARTFSRPPPGWTIGNWADTAGWFAGSPQTLIADYIEEGVTGVAGNVYEPYLHLTPRPHLLLPAWAAGRNLAEAFYVSMPALSWQNIVVGDPLCTLGPPPKQ